MSKTTTVFASTRSAFFYLAAGISLLLVSPIAEAAQSRERIGGVRIPFIANHGQTDDAVAYYAPTFAGTVYVTRKGEIVYSLPAPANDNKDSSSTGTVRRKATGTGWTLTETPVGGSPRVTAEDRAVAQVNYFIGSEPQLWRASIYTHESVGLGEVWPGVTISLRAHGDNVEKLFTVRPGADPSRIRMRVTGASSLRVNDAGALVAETALGEVTFTRPVAYQERNGARRQVHAAYSRLGMDYGFSVSGFDRELPLIIDPLLQSTYLGNPFTDEGIDIAIHPASGDVYMIGITDSPNFPGTVGGAQPAYGGGTGDVFIARVNSSLTSLLQATYLGGNTSDLPGEIVIHPATGEIYVAGTTGSINFPGAAGGAQPTHGSPGNFDAFVARLNPTLTSLLQSTFFGGSAVEEGNDLFIHPTSGEVYLAGSTASTNLPGATGGAQPAFGATQPASQGLRDAFVARFNQTLTTLGQATYLGGEFAEVGQALAIHPTSGEVVVAGMTESLNFPGRTGGAQPARAGGQDAFIARLNAALTALLQSTYFGGNGNEAAPDLAIHQTSGEIYIAGPTLSNNLPGTTGGAQPTPAGPSNAFITRFNAALTVLLQATYFTGSNNLGVALNIHPTTAEVYLGGQTNSASLPGTAGGAQAALAGTSDGFLARLNPALTTLIQSTYLGGSAEDRVRDLAFHPTSGDVYAGGDTQSTNFPATAGGAQPANAGFRDTFGARLTADLAGAPVPAPPTITNGPPPNGTVGVSYSFTYTSTGSPTFSVSAGSLPPGLNLSSAGVISGTPTTAGTFTGTVTASNGTLPNATQNFSIIITAAATAIPTLGGWALILLTILLAGAGLRMWRP